MRLVPLCRWDAIREAFEANPVYCEGCGVCVYFCPEKAIYFPIDTCGEWYISGTRFGPMVHTRLGIAEENSGKLVALVRQEARKLAEKRDHQLILTDGPPGVGRPVIAAIGGATAVLIFAVSGVNIGDGPHFRNLFSNNNGYVWGMRVNTAAEAAVVDSFAGPENFKEPTLPGAGSLCLTRRPTPLYIRQVPVKRSTHVNLSLSTAQGGGTLRKKGRCVSMAFVVFLGVGIPAAQVFTARTLRVGLRASAEVIPHQFVGRYPHSLTKGIPLSPDLPRLRL